MPGSCLMEFVVYGFSFQLSTQWALLGRLAYMGLLVHVYSIVEFVEHEWLSPSSVWFPRQYRVSEQEPQASQAGSFLHCLDAC